MNDYVILFNSKNGNGASNDYKEFFFDWSIMENTKYLLETSIETTTIGVGQSPTFVSKVGMYYIDFGANNNEYITSSSMQAQQSGNMLLGFLRPEGAFTMRSSDIDFNPKIHINGRPRNNRIIIQLLDQFGAPFVQTGGTVTTTPPDYFITLHFKKVKD